MTSSIKKEVDSISLRRQRRTEPRPFITRTKNLVKIGRVVPKTGSRTDKQTGRQTRSSQQSAPLSGAEKQRKIFPNIPKNNATDTCMHLKQHTRPKPKTHLARSRPKAREATVLDQGVYSDSNSHDTDQQKMCSHIGMQNYATRTSLNQKLNPNLNLKLDLDLLIFDTMQTHKRELSTQGYEHVCQKLRKSDDCQLRRSQSKSKVYRPEMDMGWVHPWVGLGWVGLNETHIHL